MMPEPTDSDGRIDNVVNLLDLQGGRTKGVHRVLEKLQGKPAFANVSNAMVILAHDPMLAGMLGYSEFILSPLMLRAPPPAEDGAPALPGPYPRPWSPEDSALILGYVQRIWCPKMKKGDLAEAMWAEASQRRFHPVRDWLGGLVWDGKPRIDTWLRKVFSAPDDDYHAAVGAKFLIACVRRVRQPGCKFDQLVILEGPQGLGKSRACRVLFSSKWFSDSLHPDLASRDAPISLAGAWGVELGEIQHFIRNDRTVIKAFLSRQVDRYRPINGKFTIDVPRQSVLIGSTNQNVYLDDDTGNRRIWPVACTECRIDWLEENREQLWAEAAAREASGEALWIDDTGTRSNVETAQAQRLIEDVWSDPIADYLQGKTEARASDVLTVALNIPRHLQGRGQEMRVGAILRTLGWAVKIERQGSKTVRLWRPPQSQAGLL